MERQKQVVEGFALEGLLVDKPPVHRPLVHELAAKVERVVDKVAAHGCALGEELEVDPDLNDNTEKNHARQLDQVLIV